MAGVQVVESKGGEGRRLVKVRKVLLVLVLGSRVDLEKLQLLSSKWREGGPFWLYLYHKRDACGLV